MSIEHLGDLTTLIKKVRAAETLNEAIDLAGVALSVSPPPSEPPDVLKRFRDLAMQWRRQAEGADTEAEQEKRTCFIGALKTEAKMMRGFANSLNAVIEEVEDLSASWAPPAPEAAPPQPEWEKAVRLILANPYGCQMCDSGKMRNPAKEHFDDCGFALAQRLAALSAPFDDGSTCNTWPVAGEDAADHPYVPKAERAALASPSPKPESTRRPALELAETLKRFWNTLPEEHRHLSLLAVIDELSALSAVTPPEWQDISTVPDDLDRILTIDNGRVVTAKRGTNGMKQRGWFSEGPVSWQVHPIAWMPLPALPPAEKEQ